MEASQDIESFVIDTAITNLKDAGSLAAWKKGFKEEYKYWSKKDEIDEIKEKAGVLEAPAAKKKSGLVQPLKVTISATNALALNEVLKDRGLKKFDISEVLDEALMQVPEEWWEQKKEDLTPIEWKIQKISQNPDLMSKLTDQLDELLAAGSKKDVH